MSKSTLILTIVFIIGKLAFAGDIHTPEIFGECTIGVFGADATSDGRPMIWKNRDVGNSDQRFIYYWPYERDGITTLAFTGNCYRNDTTRIYMGANEHGFAIMNSDSYNLGDSLSQGIDDGTLMRLALETCRTLRDFEELLDSTNITGRLDCWNFGCLDSTGNSALYECANHWYGRYRPEDEPQASQRYFLRSNFSFSGNSSHVGRDRYDRALLLTRQRAETCGISAAFILESLARDLGNIYDDPYPFPYNGSQNGGPPGYIYNIGITICNTSTRSAVVIKGANGQENASRTTIYAMIGSPILSLAFPLWVISGEVPVYLSSPEGSPIRQLCQIRQGYLYDNPQAAFYLNSRYLFDTEGNGVYSYTLPLERWGICQAESLLDIWGGEPQIVQAKNEQDRIADMIFAGFYRQTDDVLENKPGSLPLPKAISMSNYPNPFNDGTIIRYSGTDSRYPVTIRIFDMLGRQVANAAGNNSGNGAVYWAGRDADNHKMSSGIYMYILENGPFTARNKMLIIR